MTGFLTIEGVSKAFRPNLSLGERIAASIGATVETRPLQAVDDVSLGITEGETLGLVGESGCGKSTLVAPESSRPTRAPCGWTDSR